jgi:hypothetical protein
MMPITNYDTRPAAPPLFGADRAKKHRYVPEWMAFATWFFGLVAIFGTIAWAWAAVDRWGDGTAYLSISTAGFIAMGVATLAFWLVTAFLLWLPRRH